MTQVTMHTDGACSGNPGPAGWAAILVCGEHEKEVVGGATESTNNQAELSAVIIGLEALKLPCKVVVNTDSQYVVGVMSKGWKRKANLLLLATLDALCKEHEVKFVHVRGHAGNELNKRCDQLAKAAVKLQRSIIQSGALTFQDCLDMERAEDLPRPGYCRAYGDDAVNDWVVQFPYAKVERQRSKADFTGTQCIVCGDLSRDSQVCDDCRSSLSA